MPIANMVLGYAGFFFFERFFLTRVFFTRFFFGLASVALAPETDVVFSDSCTVMLALVARARG